MSRLLARPGHATDLTKRLKACSCDHRYLGTESGSVFVGYTTFTSIAPLGGGSVQIDPNFYLDSSRICPLK